MRYLGFHIPLGNVPSLVHGSIFKFDELQVRNTLLLGSTLRFHIPLGNVRLLLIEDHIHVSKDLVVFGIPEPISVLISSVSNEDAPLRLWVQLAPVT